MAKNKLYKIEELIRIAADRILSKTEKNDIEMNDQTKAVLYKQHPECFISIKRLGRDTSPYLFPLCNRAFVIDPKILNISYGMIQKLLSDDEGLYDVNALQSVLTKLTRMRSIYRKTIAKPPRQAARKAVVTKMFNNIKGHLQVISQKQ